MKHVKVELNSFYFLRNSDLFLDNLNLIGLFNVTGLFIELYFVVNKRNINNKIRYTNSDKSSKF